MRTFRRFLTAALALTLACGSVACSDEDEPSAETDSTETDSTETDSTEADATTTSTEAESASTADDESVIEEALLTLDDLPEGYEETAGVEDPAENQCEDTGGIDAAALEAATVFEGGPVEFQFISDELLIGVGAEISSFSDPEPAAERLVAMTSSEFLDCVVQSFEEGSAANGQEVGTVTAESVEPLVDGDGASLLRVRFETQGLPSVLEQHVVLVGRFGVGLQMVAVNGQVDQALAQELLETMIDRLGAAAGD